MFVTDEVEPEKRERWVSLKVVLQVSEQCGSQKAVCAGVVMCHDFIPLLWLFGLRCLHLMLNGRGRMGIP